MSNIAHNNDDANDIVDRTSVNNIAIDDDNFEDTAWK